MKVCCTLAVAACLFFAASPANACNVCGCGVGTSHYGILPQFNKNFVGLRYHSKTYRSRLEEDHLADYSDESFQQVELWARYYPTRRLQLFAFVPYKFNERIEGSDRLGLTGLGDILISANYTIVNTYDSLVSGFTQSLVVGGGVKLPTGNFQAIEDGLTVNQNFQLGTGSVDFLLNLMYTVRLGKLGLNTELVYTYTTTNKDEYRFGNSTTGGISFFYLFEANNLSVMPFTGMTGEFFLDNRQFGVPFEDTGGWALLYEAGLQVYFKNIVLGGSVQFPGNQALFNGHVTSNDRFSAHLTFMF